MNRPQNPPDLVKLSEKVLYVNPEPQDLLHIPQRPLPSGNGVHERTNRSAVSTQRLQLHLVIGQLDEYRADVKQKERRTRNLEKNTSRQCYFFTFQTENLSGCKLIHHIFSVKSLSAGKQFEICRNRASRMMIARFQWSNGYGAGSRIR